jgi:hypothetical protein
LAAAISLEGKRKVTDALRYINPEPDEGFVIPSEAFVIPSEAFVIPSVARDLYTGISFS